MTENETSDRKVVEWYMRMVRTVSPETARYMVDTASHDSMVSRADMEIIRDEWTDRVEASS